MRLLNAMKLLKKFKISNIKQSYCLKCRKNTDSINPRVSKTKKGKTMIYQKVQYLVVKNQDLLKNKRQVKY